MGTIKEACDSFNLFVNEFEQSVSNTVKNNGDKLVEYVHEQLNSGINGRGKNLRPTYLNDPYFKTEEAGRWRNNASGYMKFKKRMNYERKITSYLGIPMRSDETPNLIIRGDFYDSITAVPISGGVSIETKGVSFGKDVENKYGSIIFGVSGYGRRHFINYVLSPELQRLFQKYDVR